MGVSCDTFYRYRELADEGGVDVLINRNRRPPNLKNRTDEETEQAVVDYAVAFPAHGQHRTSNELRKQGVFISGSGVRYCWVRSYWLSRYSGRQFASPFVIIYNNLIY